MSPIGAAVPFEDSSSGYVRIYLEDNEFSLVGQRFSSGSEYEWGRQFTPAQTLAFARALNLPLDDHFLERVAARFDGSYNELERYLSDNKVDHKFWNYF